MTRRSRGQASNLHHRARADGGRPRLAEPPAGLLVHVADARRGRWTHPSSTPGCAISTRRRCRSRPSPRRAAYLRAARSARGLREDDARDRLRVAGPGPGQGAAGSYPACRAPSRSQRELAPPAPGRPRAGGRPRSGSSSRRAIAAAIARGVEGVEQQRGVAGDLGQRGGVRAGDRHAARHRLEHRQPEALVQRREHERRPPAPTAPRARRRPTASRASARRRRSRAPARALAQLAPRARSGSRASTSSGRSLPAGSARARRSARVRFLCGRLADRLSSDAAARRARSARASRARAAASARRRAPNAERDDVDLRRRRTCSSCSEIVARARRVGDHPVASGAPPAARARACRGRGARVRLGEARVDQVVDGHDAAEAPPQRRGAGQAVHEVDAGARRPGAAAASARRAPTRMRRARPDRHGHRRHELAPRPGASAARLAVDERGEAHAGGRRPTSAGISSRA